MESKSISKSARKAALTTVATVILTAILIVSIVGGAGYVYSTQTDAIVAELKSENSKLGSQVRTSQEETAKLSSQIIATQEEGKQLKSLNDQLNSQIKVVGDDNGKLKSQLGAAQDEISKVKSTNDNLGSQIRMVEDDNSRLKSQLSSLSADLKTIADIAGIPLGNSEAIRKLIEERKVVEAAKMEGKVVLYTAASAAIMEPQRKAFESRYPFITVEIVYGVTGGRAAGGSGALASRFISEFDKGIKFADILQLDSVGTRDVQQRQSELLAKYISRDSGYVPEELRDKDGRWAAVNTALWTIAYNTKLVSKEEAPKSFRDLTDPKWKGKIAAADLRTVPSFVDRFRAMEKQYGEDFIRQLATQNIRYYPTFGELQGRVANGEFSILLVATPSLVDQAKAAGQPIEWVKTSDNAYFSTYGWLGIASNAPHQNAAKLWVDFMFSKEGMQIQAGAGSLPTMPGIRLANPDTALQGKKLIAIEQLSDSERKAFLEKYPALAP